MNELGRIKAVENRKKLRGQWRINSDEYYPYCSICRNEPQDGVMTKYCPNCGAFMEEILFSYYPKGIL